MLKTATLPGNRQRWLPFVFLLGGIIALSNVPIFILMAQAEHVPSLAIAALRVAFAALMLTPYVLSRHRAEIRSLQRRDIALLALAGLALFSGLFLSFVALEHTTVLIANLLVNTHPLWVAILEVLALKAVLGRRVWLGLALALTGTVVFGLAGILGRSGLGDNPLLGGSISLIAAFIAASYFVLGRSIRRRVSTLVFMWLVLIFGALAALMVSLISGTALLGYSLQGYFWILITAIIGQVIGQSLFAYCLAYLPATLVSISMQGIVIGSAILAFFIFGEQPGPLQLVASLVILAGVILVISTRAHQPAT